MRGNADVAGNDAKNRNQNKQVGKSGSTLANGNTDLIVDQGRTITGYASFYSPAQSRDKCDTDSQKPALRSIIKLERTQIPIPATMRLFSSCL